MFDDLTVVQRIKLARLPWAGHVVRTETGDPARYVFLGHQQGQQTWSSFVELNECYYQNVILADGTATRTEGIGLCRELSREDKTSRVALNDVLFVPSLEINLVSMKKLAVKGAVVLSDLSGCRIVKDQKVFAAATSRGLY